MTKVPIDVATAKMHSEIGTVVYYSHELDGCIYPLRNEQGVCMVMVSTRQDQSITAWRVVWETGGHVDHQNCFDLQFWIDSDE
jgi:hypothetical protein